jgi:hypothetical protein
MGFMQGYLQLGEYFYKVGFENLYNLRNYLFPETYKLEKKYPLDSGDIIVSEITKDEIKKTIAKLVEGGHFDKLKPLDKVYNINDIKEELYAI